MADAIKTLKEDHEKVRELFKKLEDTKDDQREKLLQDIEHELLTHAALEEEIFYPAFRDSNPEENKETYHEAKQEHHVVKLLLSELSDMNQISEEAKAKTIVLKEIVEHHADEEEKEMFPKAEKLMSKEALERAGKAMEERKEDLVKFYTAHTRESAKAAKRA